MHTLFIELAKTLENEEEALLDVQIEHIEKLLAPYWFNDKSKSTYMAYELYKGYLIEEDYQNLLKNQSSINALDTTVSPRLLFSKIGAFSSLYFESINHLLQTYKEEIETDQLMIVTKVSENVIHKTDKLTTSPSYDYTAFLLSRAFAISDSDMNDLYYTYEDIQNKDNKKGIKKLHAHFSPYWLKEETVEQFIPYKTYETSTFKFLEDTQIKTLKELYRNIENAKDEENVVLLINSMIAFNEFLGDALEARYTSIYDAYDLTLIIKNKGD